jgi:hypothetical protein
MLALDVRFNFLILYVILSFFYSLFINNAHNIRLITKPVLFGNEKTHLAFLRLTYHLIIQ